MTTRLHKPVAREVVIGRSLQIVTMTAHGVTFREKGRRVTYTLPWEYAVHRAARLFADNVIAERRKNRRAKK